MSGVAAGAPRPALLPLVRRVVAHEARVLAGLARWVLRRRDDGGGSAEAFGHARDQAAMMYGMAFVCVVETVALSFLLAPWPVVHAFVLYLDVYTVLMVLGLHACSVTRPHLLTGGPDGVLRLRQSAWFDLAVPLAAIDTVGCELRAPDRSTRVDGVLDLPVGGQTSVTLRLTEPVEVTGFLGRTRRVEVVRFHADAPRELVTRVRRARSGRCG
ncbi:hypothetical protein [Streptomyces sp. NPDC060194]|uniref:hypothetical protein n=1 Tax=Streptomyces sp. NPDC060194 TaxID=3347069 RepID=UPI0036552453